MLVQQFLILGRIRILNSNTIWLNVLLLCTGADRRYEGSLWNNNRDSYDSEEYYDGRRDDGYEWRYNEEPYQQGPLPFRFYDHKYCRPEGSRSSERYQNDGTKW